MYASNEPAAMCVSCASHPGPFRDGQTVTKGSLLNDNDLNIKPEHFERDRSSAVCSFARAITHSLDARVFSSLQSLVIAAAAGCEVSRGMALDATASRVYWLGDSTISLLYRDDGRRWSKKRKANDACADAWAALDAAIPSINLGERGQQLTQRVGSTRPLRHVIDDVIRDSAASKLPRPCGFVISSGYNNLGVEKASEIIVKLMAQVDKLHAHFPHSPVLLLGIAVSYNGNQVLQRTALEVTELMAVESKRRTGWLTMLHPTAWLEQAEYPVWEEEDQKSGSTLHLSIRSRVQQLQVLRTAVITMLSSGTRPAQSAPPQEEHEDRVEHAVAPAAVHVERRACRSVYARVKSPATSKILLKLRGGSSHGAVLAEEAAQPSAS